MTANDGRGARVHIAQEIAEHSFPTHGFLTMAMIGEGCC